MSAEFRSLLTKEWSERRSFVQLATLLYLLLLGYCVAYEFEYRTRALVASCYGTSLVCGYIGAVLLAMSTTTGEYTRGTLKFSQSLPVPLSTVAWPRLLGAWACLAIPILLGSTILTVMLAIGLVEQAGLRSLVVQLSDRPSLTRLESIRFLWTTTAVGLTALLNFVTLLCLLGTRCRSEGTVGFMGAIGFLGTMTLVTLRSTLEKSGLLFLADWIGALVPGTLAINWGFQDIDGSVYTDLELAPLIAGPLTVNLLVTLGLAWLFANQYGSRLNGLSGKTWSCSRWLPSVRIPRLISRLRFRFRSRLLALAWVDARQSLPLCLAGLTMAVLITLVGMTDQRHGISTSLLNRLAGELPTATWFVGALWAAIVAVAAFSSDLKPGLEQFWRSRPISPRTWFWTKFVVGLVAVLATLDLLPALMARSASYHPSSGRIGIAYVACIPLIHALIYSMAVASVGYLRRPIPAAVVALFLYYGFDCLLASIPSPSKLSTLDVFNRLEGYERHGIAVDLSSQGYPIVYGLALLVIVGATLFGCRTMIPAAGMARRIPLILLCALAWTQASVSTSGAEPALDDVFSGMRQRDALVHDVRMRISTRLHRTNAYFSMTASMPRHEGAIRSEQPRDEVKQFVLFERLPCRTWNELDSAGKVVSTVAFDGTTIRQFTIGHPRSAYRAASDRPNEVPFLHPDALTTANGNKLNELLANATKVVVKTREVAGETLIDFSFAQPAPLSAPPANGLALPTPDYRYRVTVNATRNFWPVSILLEIPGPDGIPIHQTRATAREWIDAGAVVFPKFITIHTSGLGSAPGPDGKPQLELLTSQEAEVIEVQVNSGLPDSAFTPLFPPGSILFEPTLQQNMVVAEDGSERIYYPTPKGLRGSILAYQLMVVGAGIVYLVRQKAVV